MLWLQVDLIYESRIIYVQFLRIIYVQFLSDKSPCSSVTITIFSFSLLYAGCLLCPLSIYRWNLVEIDADLLKLTFEMKHVMTLIDPSKTYMVFFFHLVVY